MLIRTLLLFLAIALIIGIAGGVLYGGYWYEIGGMLMALVLVLMRFLAEDKHAKTCRTDPVDGLLADRSPPLVSAKRSIAERKAARAERKRRKALAGNQPAQGQ